MSQTENANPLAVFRAEADLMEKQFRAALPKQIPADRFARVVQTAVQNNPALLKVERRSLWNAVMKAAHDGLLPDGREAALVVYRDKRRGEIAQYMPMIAGIRKKVRNSGDLDDWSVQVVRMNDFFEHELGDNPFIRHAPHLDDPGAFRGVYSIATLKGGGKSYEVMNKAQVDAIRERSRAATSGPWVTDYEEMARKTVAKRHAKVLPMSTDLDDLLRRDDDLDEDDNESPGETAIRAPERRAPPTVTARLDALVQPATSSSSGIPGDDTEDPSAGVDFGGATIDLATGEIVPAEVRQITPAELEQVRQAWNDTRTAPAQLAAAVEARDRQYAPPDDDEPAAASNPPPSKPPMISPEEYVERLEMMIETAEDAEQITAFWNSPAQRKLREACSLSVDEANALRKKLTTKVGEIVARPPAKERQL